MSDRPGFAVIVTALDETWSVNETVHRVVADNKDDLTEIIMATAPHATTACRAAIADMCAPIRSWCGSMSNRICPGWEALFANALPLLTPNGLL